MRDSYAQVLFLAWLLTWILFQLEYTYILKLKLQQTFFKT